MRFLLSLFILMLTGCSLCGSGGNCQSTPDCQAQQGCEDCQECQSCGKSGCSSWWCSLGCCCYGRHPHYRRCSDNLVTRTEARFLAKSDLRELDDDICLSCDYRLGYEQAFVDVSLGSCGDVPALPPANYWKNSARTPEGHNKAQQWFSGYAAGAVRAKGIYEPFNKVAHSQFYCDEWYGYQPDCNSGLGENGIPGPGL